MISGLSALGYRMHVDEHRWTKLQERGHRERTATMGRVLVPGSPACNLNKRITSHQKIKSKQLRAYQWPDFSVATLHKTRKHCHWNGTKLFARSESLQMFAIHDKTISLHFCRWKKISLSDISQEQVCRIIFVADEAVKPVTVPCGLKCEVGPQ